MQEVKTTAQWAMATARQAVRLPLTRACSRRLDATRTVNELGRIKQSCSKCSIKIVVVVATGICVK